jgi:hypothetical protein
MALTPILRAVAEYQANDIVRAGNIMLELNEASMCGPWRYSPEDVAGMWQEEVECAERIANRREILSRDYDPWVSFQFDLAVDSFVSELS